MRPKSNTIWSFFSLVCLFVIIMGYQNCGDSPKEKSNKATTHDPDPEASGVAPNITSNLPSSVRVGEGDNYTMSIQASGTGTLTYQWFKNDQSIEGEDENFLQLNSVSQSDEGRYRVIVGFVGGRSVGSEELSLTVTSSTPSCTGNQIYVGNTCESCPAGQRPNAARTACEVESIPPPTCTGNQIHVGNTCESCPAGQRPNAARTACEEAIPCEHPTKTDLKRTMSKQGFKNIEDNACDNNCSTMTDKTTKKYSRSSSDCKTSTLVFYKTCNQRPKWAALKASMGSNGWNRNTVDNPCISSGCLQKSIRSDTKEGIYYPVSGQTCAMKTVKFYIHSTRRVNMGDFELVNGCVTTSSQAPSCQGGDGGDGPDAPD